MSRMLGVIFAVLALAACARKEEAPRALAAAPAPAPMARAAVAESLPGAPAAAPMAKAGASLLRHIELHHYLTVEVPAERLEAAWRERLAACTPPACEVVSAGIENARGEQANAELSVRILPAQAGGLLETLRAQGKLTQHQMSQTDRTNEVVDIQARLNNQKALRDRLRALVAARSVAKVSELLEVERELARVQGEIDSAEGQMRATLAVTEKVSFDISFRVPASFSQPGSWEPLRRAWSSLGATFAESLAALLYCAAAALPWCVPGAALIWGLRGLWRRRKAQCRRQQVE